MYNRPHTGRSARGNPPLQRNRKKNSILYNHARNRARLKSRVLRRRLQFGSSAAHRPAFCIYFLRFYSISILSSQMQPLSLSLCVCIPVQAAEALRVARVWGSHIFRHSAHRWRQGCQPYAPAAFYPPGRFLVLIFVRGWVDPRSIVRLEGLGKLKKSTSSGTQTGDLPTCSIVPQPTTLPRAP
jgi:hypothetical protein